MTRVHITVDVECREERRQNDSVLPAAGYDLRVFGRFANQAQALGIEHIMRELDEFGHKGTFFVEPLGSAAFGLEGLSDTCRTVREHGHDVQLHLHPRQTQAFWITRSESPPPDDMAAYPLDTQIALMRQGLDLLERCGVPRSELVAFRAGNFGANNDTWKAMAANGLLVSSNYNPCYFRKNCRIQWPQLEADLFASGTGVWELPVTNFHEPDGSFRHLQVTAVSLPEMKHLLMQAHRLGLQEVTLVTHSFELYHLDSVEQKRGRVNLINARRFRGLCRFLGENSHIFKVETVAELAKRLPAAALRSTSSLPRVRSHHRAIRLAEQIYKRLEARYPFQVRLPLLGSWSFKDI